MSRVDKLDLRLLKARLQIAIEAEGLPEMTASLYLAAIGCCLLACSPESPWELGIWESLYRSQALTEAVDGDWLLDVLTSVSQVVPS